MWRVRAFIRTLGWRLVNVGRWLVEHSGGDGGYSSGAVTPSCGCILCDLKLPRAKDNGPGWQTFFHQTQHGPVPCRRNF